MKKFAVFMLVLLIGVALFWFELAQYEPMFWVLGLLLLLICSITLISYMMKRTSK